MDLARLTAVDVHVHVEADQDGRTSLPEDVAVASAAYFGASPHRPTVDEIAAYYRERRIGAVVFTVDIEAFTGHPALSNEQIAEAAARHSDVLIPFASIDPAKGRAGARELRRLADFGKLDIKPQVRPKILKDNAVRVLNLGQRPAHG